MSKDRYVLRECSIHGLTEHVYVKSSKKYICCRCRSNAVQRKRHKLKHDLIVYKGGKCEICGYNRCEAALEFHHKDPSQKDFGIAYKGYTRSLEECKKEVDKCMLLCATCHREVHDKERNYDFLIMKSVVNPNKKIDDIDINVVNKLLNEGKTRQEIADEFNVSLGTIKRFLYNNGIRKLNNKIKSLNKDAVISLIKKGKMRQEIADEFNVSLPVLKRFLTNNNIRMKDYKNIPE